MAARHRSWCFTINNFTSADWFSVKNLFKTAKYGVCGEETGEAGTPHLQGYVNLSNAVTLDAMKKSLTRAHLEVARGSDQDNQKYCSKQSTNVYEVGEVSVGQGARTDIREISRQIQDGTITLRQIMFDHPEMYVRYGRAFREMFNAGYTQRDGPPEVHWRWGAAGTGKTRHIMDRHSPKNVYIKDGTPWWDGYTQQEAICIDDFDNEIPYRTLLRILDRYHEQGQIKGGYVPINSPYIYITCEFPPSHFWQGNTLAQVTRRLTSVVEIKKYT